MNFKTFGFNPRPLKSKLKTIEVFGKTENEPLINLASDEYFSALIPQKIKAPVYKIIFKDFKNGKYKFVQFFAKKARGLMARFVVENNIKKTEDLKNFNYKGYTFSGEESSKDIYVFLRKHIIAA